jgi:hypothetical protein
MTTPSGLLEWGQSGNYNAIDDRGVIGALAGFRPNGLIVAPVLTAGAGLVVNISAWSALVDCGDGTRAVIGSRTAQTITETAGGASPRTDYIWADLSVDPGTWSASIVTSIPARTGVLLGTITVPASAATAAAMTFSSGALASGMRQLTASPSLTGSYQTVLSVPISQAGLWRVSGQWFSAIGGGSAPVYMQFQGPALALCGIESKIFYGTSVWSNLFAAMAAMTGPTLPASQGFTWEVHGLVSFTAAGTLNQQARTNGSNNWWMNAGSWLEAVQVG